MVSQMSLMLVLFNLPGLATLKQKLSPMMGGTLSLKQWGVEEWGDYIHKHDDNEEGDLVAVAAAQANLVTDAVTDDDNGGVE